ncbi:ribophorin I family protein, partial [Aphelenchoides avenae]
MVSVAATRTVDLTSQIVKTSIEYEITNNGQNDLNNFVHVVPEKEEHVAWIAAYQDKKPANKLRVSRVEVIGAAKGLHYYKVELLSLVSPGKSVTVTVDYSLT